MNDVQMTNRFEWPQNDESNGMIFHSHIGDTTVKLEIQNKFGIIFVSKNP